MILDDRSTSCLKVAATKAVEVCNKKKKRTQQKVRSGEILDAGNK